MARCHPARAVLLVLLVAATLGSCTVGTSTILTGTHNVLVPCPTGVDLGAGHISHGTDDDVGALFWVLPPQAERLQFAVIDANTALPIEAEAGDWRENVVSFGTVWDGTRSTGPQQIEYPYLYAAIAIATPEPVARSVDVTWSIAALDAEGQEVGFLACG
jgi:hypothetical protein